MTNKIFVMLIRMVKQVGYSLSSRLKKQVTLRMGVDIIDYFKGMSEETGIPYQNLINLYLRECVTEQKKLSFQ